MYQNCKNIYHKNKKQTKNIQTTQQNTIKKLKKIKKLFKKKSGYISFNVLVVSRESC